MDGFVIKSKDKPSIKENGEYGGLQTHLDFVQTKVLSKPRFSSCMRVEDRYELILSRHCRCHLFLASEETATTTFRKEPHCTCVQTSARTGF